MPHSTQDRIDDGGLADFLNLRQRLRRKHAGPGLEEQGRIGDRVVEADRRDDHRGLEPTLPQGLHVLGPRLKRRSRYANQHGVVELAGGSHSKPLHINARLALLAFLRDPGAPDIVPTGRAGARLGLGRIGRWGNAIVGVAVGGFGAAFDVLALVVGLGHAGRRAQNDHIEDARRHGAILVILGSGLMDDSALFTTEDREGFALNRDHGEADLGSSFEFVVGHVIEHGERRSQRLLVFKWYEFVGHNHLFALGRWIETTFSARRLTPGGSSPVVSR